MCNGQGHIFTADNPDMLDAKKEDCPLCTPKEPEGCEKCVDSFWGPGAVDDREGFMAGGRPWRDCECMEA